MGYNVSITNSDFHIDKDKLDGCFEALKALNKRDELKTGGAWGLLPDGTSGQTERWFAWMAPNYDEICQSAEEIFQELGFESVTDGNGTLSLEEYDSKSGAEDVFLAAAAPFVRPGSFIEWEGEDGDRWRQDFDGETMTTRIGTTVWVDG